MAVADHLLRYRLMTADELVAEKARLNALNSGFSQQSMGSKSFMLATRDVLDQLNAVAFVQRERGYTIPDSRVAPNTQVFITDFSGVDCSQ